MLPQAGCRISFDCGSLGERVAHRMTGRRMTSESPTVCSRERYCVSYKNRTPPAVFIPATKTK